ncbi:hypothetical protein BD324DRAFT_657762 [Kockovaella imperatae]|uniref:Structure-specific endonuclease subunit SLX4 n=1 Tax=Kockovaella imperatae TaxID=4999 RepID=A0A1Y1UA54_9TREE|nr:hypothetical protein BD324DRAFT_657762 [Kockovaella imperatae]ORX34397.1 hypothetical protein BD324DRAFT_657762 [Kockovaella imperatae]
MAALEPTASSSSSSSSSSDEPILISRPNMASMRPFASARAAIRSVSAASASRATGISPKKGKTVAAPIADGSDDEPIFLGGTAATNLANKFAFRSLSTTSRVAGKSAPENSALPPSASTESSTKRLVLRAPSPTKEPLPVPSWLGKTAVLLKVRDCPLCTKEFKKSDSGAARWRHISTCLPPLYRPPNAPPDLPRLIHDVLHNVDGIRDTPSLLDLHVNALPENVDDRRIIPGENVTISSLPGWGNPTKATKAKSKTKNGPSLGLNITTVQAAQDRGDGWDDQVGDRVKELIGLSSPSSTTGQPEDPTPTPAFSSQFPSTQPMGESSLAARYRRSPSSNLDSASDAGSSLASADDIAPSSSPKDWISSLDITNDDQPSLPPSAQKRTRSPSADSAGSPTISPFNGGEVRRPKGISPRKSIRRSKSLDKEGDTETGDQPNESGSKSRKARITRKKAGTVESSMKESSGSGSDEEIEVVEYRTSEPVIASSPITVVSPSSTVSVNSTSPLARKAGTRLRDVDSATPTPKTPRVRKSTTKSAPLNVIASPISSDEPATVKKTSRKARSPSSDVSITPIVDKGKGRAASKSASKSPRRATATRVEAACGAYTVFDESATSSSVDSASDMVGSEDDWGADAILEFDPDIPALFPAEGNGFDVERVSGGNASDHSSTSETMPDFKKWKLKELKALVESYGYKIFNKKDTLVRVAEDCWTAIHHPGSSPTAKARHRRIMTHLSESGESAESSEDIPLAMVQGKSSRSKRSGGTTVRRKRAESSTNVPEITPQDRARALIYPMFVEKDLEKAFKTMILEDEEMYVRILRYEPMSFDELVAKAIRRGIEAVGWKGQLARFLDLQGITYFTGDPQGARRRR